MKGRKFFAGLALSITALFALAGCAGNATYVSKVDVIETENGTQIVTTYSDGSTEKKNIQSGQDGKDGQNASAEEYYDLWLEKNGLDDTAENYNAFLKSLDLDLAADNSATVQRTLSSVATVYCEYVYSQQYSTSIWGRPQTKYGIGMSMGSAFIYDIEENTDGYTYLVTNAHVVYCSNADLTANAVDNPNGSGYLPRAIHCFLYGSYDPQRAYGATTATDPTYGYNLVEYSPQAVECDLVGLSISSDLAVVRAKTRALKAVNSDIREVELADVYYVGQTVFTVGNTEGQGLNATQGIISVDNEEISLSIDKKRTYRSMRIDAFIYEGNSGGGLFNVRGQLVGVVHAGDGEHEEMNYAVPLEIVKAVVPNLLDGYNGESPAYAAKPTLGVTVFSESAKYSYDSAAGYGKITEKVVVSAVTEGSLAARAGVLKDDLIKSLTIGSTVHPVTRSFSISDALFCARANDEITITVSRNGETKELKVTVTADDLKNADA